eukprot:TRINITY_DN70317_c0_g1_i1.p1 TRINITY_DN70317_c0_g1~~TRINITY_DN70317_c0_g1_i1.p1  ORF type:complete len:339 (+),score=24.33 TRINITY_DN70317_c0_g1_i1:85-1017(+)
MSPIFWKSGVLWALRRRLGHVGTSGLPQMVDVSEKKETRRFAIAEAVVLVPTAVIAACSMGALSHVEPRSLTAVSGAKKQKKIPSELSGSSALHSVTGCTELLSAKGAVFATAVVAATQAAKSTPTLIPLCHSLPLSGVDVDIRVVSRHPLATPFVVPPLPVSCEPTGTTHSSDAPDSDSREQPQDSKNSSSRRPRVRHGRCADGSSVFGAAAERSPAATIDTLPDAPPGCVVPRTAIRLAVAARTTAATGVEMEALTGAAVGSLTVLDMLKGAAPAGAIEVACVRLLCKEGGKRPFRACSTASMPTAAV